MGCFNDLRSSLEEWVLMGVMADDPWSGLDRAVD